MAVQAAYRLDVTGPREHVDSRGLAKRIAQLLEAQNVPGQRCGVAGDVNNALRSHVGDCADGSRAHSFAGRIHDHDARTQSPLGESPGRFARVRTEELRVGDAVAPGVFPCVFHRLGHDLRSDDSSRVPRHAQADGAGAAVQIEHQIFRPGRRVFGGFFVKPFRLAGMDLEKSLGRDGIFQAAEPVVQDGISPQGIEFSGQDGVSSGFVDVTLILTIRVSLTTDKFIMDKTCEYV